MLLSGYPPIESVLFQTVMAPTPAIYSGKSTLATVISNILWIDVFIYVYIHILLLLLKLRLIFGRWLVSLLSPSDWYTET